MLGLATTLSLQEAAALGLADLSAQDASPIARWLELVPECVDAVDPAAAHLVLTSGGAPPGAGAWLGVGAADGEREDLIGPFLAERQHPLLEGVSLEGIVWSHDPTHRPPGVPLVSAGNDPLLTESVDGDRRAFHLDLDPRRSSLTRSPDWPILLANLAELVRADLPGPVRTNLQAGDEFVWRDAPAGTYSLDGPGDPSLEVALLTTGDLIFDAPPEPGHYRLLRDGVERGTLGVSFADAAESDLRGLTPGSRAAEGDEASVRAEFTWIEVALLAAVLACVVADWLVLGRGTRPKVAARGRA